MQGPSWRGRERETGSKRPPHVRGKAIADMLDTDMSLEQKRHLRMELLWLKDPAKLAQTVKRILAKGELQKALNIVRLASTSENKPIVAWNAILSYVAEQRDFKSAFKLYNEMKKRAQYPDSYTAVHFLRGLAQKPVGSEQVRLAIHLHESLGAENSKVERSIIHTNAAMQVCINAHDYDSMWTLVSKLPDQGRGAADQITFDAILTSLRKDVETKPRSDTDYEEKVAKTIRDGRGIWQDVIRRWKKGYLKLDESLVCNYLRLLLLDPSHGTSLEVLSIIEETMGISTKVQRAEHAKITPAHGTDQMSGQARHGQKHVARCIPGKIALSVILQTYLGLNKQHSATFPPIDYHWNTLTKQLGVQPDLENYHSLLRNYMFWHDSKHALETIEEMRGSNKQDLVPGRTAYILAFTACAREANAFRSNRAIRVRPVSMRGAHSRTTSTTSQVSDGLTSILQRAHKLFDDMLQGSAYVPSRPMAKFLECAIVTQSAANTYAALQKVMPILQAQVLGKHRYSNSNNTVSRRDSELGSFAEDRTALVWLTIELMRTLQSARDQEVLGMKGESDDLKTWLSQLERWSQEHGTGQIRFTESKYLEAFQHAVQSKSAELHKRPRRPAHSDQTRETTVEWSKPGRHRHAI